MPNEFWAAPLYCTIAQRRCASHQNRPAVYGRLVVRAGSLPLPAEVLLAPPASNQEDIANLLRGTPRLNVLITRTVPGVSGQCRTAV